MGVVYEATQTALDRQVALKVLARPAAWSPVRRERFRREAIAVSRLRHGAIVAVHVKPAAPLHVGLGHLGKGVGTAAARR